MRSPVLVVMSMPWLLLPAIKLRVAGLLPPMVWFGDRRRTPTLFALAAVPVAFVPMKQPVIVSPPCVSRRTPKPLKRLMTRPRTVLLPPVMRRPD